MKVKIQIPESVKDVVLKDYQEFARVQSQYKDKEADEHIAQRMVSIFGNVSMADLRKITLDKYDVAVTLINKLFEEIPTFRHTISIDGQKFGFIPDLENITLGEYVDIDNYIKDPKDWHKFMAVCYRPITMTVRDTYEIEEYNGSDRFAEIMALASFADCYAAVLFFWTLTDELLTATMTYLMEESKTTIEGKGQGSANDGDGINLSTISQARMLLNSKILQGFHFTPVSLN